MNPLTELVLLCNNSNSLSAISLKHLSIILKPVYDFCFELLSVIPLYISLAFKMFSLSLFNARDLINESQD